MRAVGNGRGFNSKKRNIKIPGFFVLFCFLFIYFCFCLFLFIFGLKKKKNQGSLFACGLPNSRLYESVIEAEFKPINLDPYREESRISNSENRDPRFSETFHEHSPQCYCYGELA